MPLSKQARRNSRRRLLELSAAQLAEEQERLRSALLSSASHDLRTPLASIIGAAISLRTLDAQLTQQDRFELLGFNVLLIGAFERLNLYRAANKLNRPGGQAGGRTSVIFQR